MPKIIVLNAPKHSQDFFRHLSAEISDTIKNFLKDKTDEEIAFEIQELEKEEQ